MTSFLHLGWSSDLRGMAVIDRRIDAPAAPG